MVDGNGDWFLAAERPADATSSGINPMLLCIVVMRPGVRHFPALFRRHVASMAIDPLRDNELRQPESTHLFPENVAAVGT